jgi:hypothetical protein
MIDLNKEAQDYFDNNIYCDGVTKFEEDISIRCFKAGALSSYVKAEKIKTKIEVLESVLLVYPLTKEVEDDIKLGLMRLKSHLETFKNK